MGNDQSKAAQAAQEYSNYANHARRGSLLVSNTGRNSMASPGPYSAPASAPPPYSVIQEEPQSGAVPFPPQNSPTSNYNPYLAGTYHQQQPQQQPVAHRRAASHAGYGSPPVAGSSHARMNTVARAGRHSMPHTASPPPAPPTRQPSIAAAAAPPPAAGANLARRNSKEDALLMLAKYDTVIIVDDSSSMEGPLWFEAREALAGVADIAGKYDSDGIDIHFLNDDRVGKGFSARDVERLFDLVHPRGITPTGEKLEILLLDYLLKLEDAKEAANAGDPRPLQAIKPVNFIIITDGAPTDDPESVIVAAARRLDAGRFPITQVGIQFVQIGNDPGAKEALQELDDDLAGRYGIRDIVDTTPYSGQQLDAQTLTKILLGGINKRVDRRGAV